jgi:lipid II:glycine glycyltransferase (peptidoglycan interpeptide bridge formation enzyme)
MNKITIELLPWTSAKKVLSELEKSLPISPFHSYAWLNTVVTTLHEEPEIYIFKEDRKIIGMIPFFLKKKGMTIRFSPPFSSETAYGGIVAAPGHMQKLYAVLGKEVSNFFIVHPGLLHLPDCICEPKHTVITTLNCTSVEEHFKRLAKGHRYNVTKAHKDNLLELREDYNEQTLKDYYELLKETYAYNDFSPLPLAFYSTIISHFKKQNSVKLIVAYWAGRPVGTICAFHDKHTLYYWTGGFSRDPAVTKLYPNDVLQWQIIQWGYQKKIPRYDMLGADIAGIRQFKLGFGGELVSYTKIYSSRRLHVLAKIYAKLGSGLKHKLRR